MAFPAGWGRRAPITIQAVGETLTNFPVHLDKDCFPAEALDTGSANKALSDGGDIRFSSDTNGTSPLACHVVRWVQDAVAGNRKATVVVKVPSLGTSTTTIYVWYKNPSTSMPTSSDTYGSDNVYDSHYKGVWHLNNGSGISSVSPGGTAGTIEGSPATFTESPVGLAMDLDGTDDAVHFGVNNYTDNLFEMVIKNQSTSAQIHLGTSNSTGPQASMSMQNSSTFPTAFMDDDGGGSYRKTYSDNVAASTTNFEYWAVRNRCTSGGAVVSRALPATEQSGPAYCTDGTYMYTIGGATTAGGSTPATTHNRYDPSANTWATRTAAPVALRGTCAVCIGTKIYYFGGVDSTPSNNTRLDIYDITGNSWSSGTAVPSGIAGGSGQRGVTDGTDLYAYFNGTIQKYSVSGNSWTNLAALTSGIGSSGAMLYVSGNIYVVDGTNATGVVSKYNISGNTWTNSYDTVPAGFEGFAQVFAPVGDGTFLIGFGSKTSNPNYRKLYNYDPVNKIWTAKKSYEIACGSQAAFINSSKLYVYGAWNASKLTTTASFGHHARYDISGDSWDTVPPVWQFYRDATVVNGDVLDSALFTATGKLYVGRQDNLTTSRSTAEVALVRRSDHARTHEWIIQSRATLLTASTFSTIGTPVDVSFAGSNTAFAAYYGMISGGTLNV